MKFLVIGLGSMGRRRVHLLSEHFNTALVCGADIDGERRRQTQDLFGIHTYEDFNAAIEQEQPDAALVCTPPARHAGIILRCLEKGLHVFSEINLLPDRYEEIIKTAALKQVRLFLSSTQLYRREIQTVSDYVRKLDSRVNYRYHVGQYLPDWHPWDDGRKFFVWEKRTDACREIFSIELPWIINAFGRIEQMTVYKDKLSDLDVDYPDNYILLLKHETGHKGVFIADVVSRKVQRDLLVYSDKLHLAWEGTPDTLRRYDVERKITEQLGTYDIVEQDSMYARNIIENAYTDELSAFIAKISGDESLERYTFEEDLYTLNLIDRIEGLQA